MALDDIVFSEGDGQTFLVEIPIDTLHAPVDILWDNYSLFAMEIPVGLLYSPTDILFGSMPVGGNIYTELLVNELIFSRERASAFIG